MKLNFYKVNNNGSDKLLELMEFIENKVQFNSDGKPKEVKGEQIKEYNNIGSFGTENKFITIHAYIKNKEKTQLPDWLNVIKELVIDEMNEEFLLIDKNEFLNSLTSYSNDNYSGLIIIENKEVTLKGDNSIKNHYVISFGHSSFDLSKYIDYDFGLDLASKIGKEPISVINTTPGATNIKKNTTTYKNASLIEALDLGSSVLNFEVETVDADKWGKKIFCGKSCVFELEPTSDLNNFLVDLSEKINKALERKLETLKNLPRYVEVSDIDAEKLDIQLEKKITEKDFDLEFEKDFIRDGRFYFSHEFELQYYCGNHDNGSMPTLVLSKESFLDFVNLNKTVKGFDLLKIKVKFNNGNGIRFSKSIKELLSNIGKIQLYSGDKNSYCLKEGIWYKYNETFVKQLRKALKEINNIFHEKNLETDMLQDYLIENKKKVKVVSLNEEVFLKKRIYSDGEIKIHGTEEDKIMKVDKCKVEPADFINENTLFFVKSGSASSKLCYLVRQAKTSIKLFSDNVTNEDVKEFIGRHNVKDVKNIKLIILCDRKTPVKSLDNIDLISFQMEIYELYKMCRKYELNLSIEWLYAAKDDRKEVERIANGEKA